MELTVALKSHVYNNVEHGPWVGCGDYTSVLLAYPLLGMFNHRS
jgi:hypothetical protein